MVRYLVSASALVAMLVPACAHAESDETADIVVYGRGERRIGIAAAASEGAVAGADISVRPLLRPAELLESVPGLIATQHSGGGKANQYFLRGFNLDHGTDFGLFIDDVPINFRTHGHGQGYLDVNGLIPETVARVDYRKGSYRADAGDFTFVGMARIQTLDRADPFVALEAGGYGYRRAVAIVPAKIGGGELLLAGQFKLYDGPWALPEDFRSGSGFAKYTHETGIGTLRASLSVYDATWRPTEQIPQRAIGTLVPDAYGTLDPFLKGRTEREIFTIGLSGDDYRISFYAQHYDWSLLSNFTFFLEDPVNGDELRQYETRWTYGGRIERDFALGDRLTFKAGAETRLDRISSVGLDHTIAGRFDYVKSRFAVDERSLGLYGEWLWRPTQRLSILAGVRGDLYRFETKARAGSAWSGKVTDGIASPKLGLTYRIADGLAVYADYGQGFHSNDARGVTSPSDRAPGLVKGDFKELGARFERGGLVLTADYWWSGIDSELIYVGDSGAVEPSNPGRRHGYEATAFWKPNRWLAIDAVWTASSGRYLDVPPDQDHIPGALKNSGEIGLSAVFPSWNAAVRVRHLGPHALVEDNEARGESTTLINVRAAFTPARFEIYAELLNALNSKRHDIDYFYATRLPGEPADGVEDYNSRIVEPRQVRVGVKVPL